MSRRALSGMPSSIPPPLADEASTISHLRGLPDRHEPTSCSGCALNAVIARMLSRKDPARERGP